MVLAGESVLTVGASSFWSLTCGSSVQTWMALWLKAEKNADGGSRYSVPQINNIPTVVGAVVSPSRFLLL